MKWEMNEAIASGFIRKSYFLFFFSHTLDTYFSSNFRGLHLASYFLSVRKMFWVKMSHKYIFFQIITKKNNKTSCLSVSILSFDRVQCIWPGGLSLIMQPTLPVDTKRDWIFLNTFITEFEGKKNSYR